jgi:hypothetical protein
MCAIRFELKSKWEAVFWIINIPVSLTEANFVLVFLLAMYIPKRKLFEVVYM